MVPAAGRLRGSQSPVPATGYDPDRALVWVFGGQDNNSTDVSTLLSFDGSRWREYPAAGPVARNYPSAAFDQAREQFVMFGGTLGATLAAPETWVWNRTSWTLATPAMSPVSRVAHAMVYDSRRHVIVMFGGASNPFISTFLDDTWEWDGVTWTPITPAVKPPARVVGAATYDEARGVVLMYGGYNGGPLNDVWQYDGVAWTELPAPTAPPNRFLSPFAYDHTAREATLFGGRTFSGSDFSDTWTWDDGWRERSSFVHPKPRQRARALSVSDGRGRGAVRRRQRVDAHERRHVAAALRERATARAVLDLASIGTVTASRVAPTRTAGRAARPGARQALRVIPRPRAAATACATPRSRTAGCAHPTARARRSAATRSAILARPWRAAPATARRSASYFSLAARLLSRLFAAPKSPSLYFCITSPRMSASCLFVASSSLSGLRLRREARRLRPG